MANVKISQLPAATAVTGDDLLPIVENGATQTQKAEFSQVLSYVTSSTFDTLTVTELTSSYLSGSEVQFGSETVNQLTSSYLRIDSGLIKTSNTSSPCFVFDTDTTIGGVDRIFSVYNNGSTYEVSDTNVRFYVRQDGLTYVGSTLEVSQYSKIWPDYGLQVTNNTANVQGSGTTNPAVRVGNKNNSETEIALAVSTGLEPYLTPNDVLVVYGNGDTDVSGSLVADVEVSSEITSATYILSSTDRGKTLLFNSGTAQTITCPSGLDTGFNITAIQLGTGQLNFVGSGVTLVNRFGHSSSAGQYSAVSVIVISATQHLVVGDTA